MYMTIKTSAMLAEPADYSDPDEPVIVITATGHADVAKLLAVMTGKAKPDLDIINVGEDLGYQLENPDRGAAARALLAEARVADNKAVDILETARAIVANRELTSTKYGTLLNRWAWDVVTAPGGMVEQFPELAQPAPELAEAEPLEQQMRRHMAHIGAVRALRYLETLPDSQTATIREALLARRAAGIESTRPRRDSVILAGVS